MKIIYLKPLGGYASDMRSDTLWGMLCWGIRHLWGEQVLTQFLEDCQAGNPPFVISSTFPYKYPYIIATGSYSPIPVPFFPNPLPFSEKRAEGSQQAIDHAQLRKKYKEAYKYVCFDDFKQILSGELTADALCARILKAQETEDVRENTKGKAKSGRIPAQVEIDQTAPMLEDFSQTHNTIDRLKGSTLSLTADGNSDESTGQLFHTAEFFWTDPYADSEASNTGIFFLVDGDTSLIEPVLRLFRHWGFGSDRSTGKGFFEIDGDTQDIEFPEVTNANAMLNLSLWRPTADELATLDQEKDHPDRFHYNIEVRQGHVGGRELIRKNAHRYFSEGSVFPRVKNGNLGCLIAQVLPPRIVPEHPVWDNGFGLMLPLNWQPQRQ